MSSSTDMKSVIAATLKNLESQVAALRAALNEIPTEASPPVQPKEKRELSAAILKMNGERGAIFEELKAAWSSAHPEYVALDAAALKSAVKSGAVPAKPRFSDALQEHSRRLRENDPAKQAKYEAYRKSADAKTAKIQAARAAASAPAPAPAPPSAPASVTSTSENKRKNPWLEMTDEQKAERIAKMQTGKKDKKAAALVAAPVAVAVAVAVPSASNPFDDAVATEAPASDTESATSSKKRGPPKGVPLSEEERVRRAAKAKATRDAKKVAGAAAVPLPASPPSSSASSVIVDEIDEEKFTKQQIGSKIVYKNALGHVRAYTTEGAGIWLGMYDPVKKVIDACPEPAE